MTAKPTPAPAPARPPLLTPAQASDLLEQVMFERIVDCVDLDALYQLEQTLALMISDLDGVHCDDVIGNARAIIDRGLLRLADNLRGYLNAAAWPIPGCELCEEEADAEADAGSRGKRRPGHAPGPSSRGAPSAATADRA